MQNYDFSVRNTMKKQKKRRFACVIEKIELSLHL